MNTTFLIGNGFDVNLGMKTKYTDFYDYLFSKKDPILNNFFAKKLSKYVLWSELEYQLGQICEFIDSETKLQDFINFFNNLNAKLYEYIYLQQTVFKTNYENSSNVFQFLDDFKKFIIGHLYEENSNITFLTFNYTQTLEYILSDLEKSNYYNSSSEIIHIHGIVDENEPIYFGVNDINQIKNEKYKKELYKTLCKPFLNKMLYSKKIEKASNIISCSDNIVTYGLSFGNTDAFWWLKLGEWLINSTNPQLYVNAYPNSDTRNQSIIASEKFKLTNSLVQVMVNKDNLTSVCQEKLSQHCEFKFKKNISKNILEGRKVIKIPM